jgi:hypothetical protein
MFKIIGRMIVILLASGLIACGLYLIVQHNPSALGIGKQQAGFEGRLGRNFEQVNTGSTLSQASAGTVSRPARFRDSEHDFGGRLSLGRGLLGILRNLLIFSLITLLVIGIQKLFTQVNRKRPVRAG